MYCNNNINNILVKPDIIETNADKYDIIIESKETNDIEEMNKVKELNKTKEISDAKELGKTEELNTIVYQANESQPTPVTKVVNNYQNNVATQFSSAINGITEMMNQFMQMHMTMMQQQMQQQNEINNQFRSDLKYMYEEMLENNRTIMNMRKLDVTNRKEIRETEKEYVEEPNDFIVISECSDYYEWRKGINKAVDKIIGLGGNFKNRNEVLAVTYKELTKQYV